MVTADSSGVCPGPLVTGMALCLHDTTEMAFVLTPGAVLRAVSVSCLDGSDPMVRS